MASNPRHLVPSQITETWGSPIILTLDLISTSQTHAAGRDQEKPRGWSSIAMSLGGALFFISPFAPAAVFEPSPPLYALLHFPLIYGARLLYRLILFLRPLPVTNEAHPIRVITISDTHTLEYLDVPDGDLLIHAGDLTNKGTTSELQAQIDWLKTLPHPHKIVIAGNHDTYLDPRSRQTLTKEDQQPELDWGDIQYLQHRSVTLIFPKSGARKLKVYAAPQIPAEGFPDWAFTYPPREDAWSDTIPDDIDILVTHGPPCWHLDLYGLGCPWLLSECWRIKPKLHVFGHVHAAWGSEEVRWDDCQKAYERVSQRCNGVAALWTLLNPLNWLDMFQLISYGVRGIVWSRLWGGKGDGSVLINTALMFQSSGELRNKPQVAYL